jgi:hypothetical protein
LLAPEELMDNRPVQQRGAITIEGCPKLPLPSLRRASQARERKILAAIARSEMDAMPYRFADCASEIRTLLTAYPGAQVRTQSINRALTLSLMQEIG